MHNLIKCALLVILFGFLIAVWADEFDSPFIKDLDPDAFQTNISNDPESTWIVEFYSPQCPHCKNFSPKFKRFAENMHRFQESHGLFVAKINCIAHYSKCFCRIKSRFFNSSNRIL